MRTGSTDVLSRHTAPRRRLTVAEFHRMAEVGILGDDDRVELIEGQLVAMSPIGVRHALAVDALSQTFFAAAAGRATVRVQNPVVLDDATQPQPDIALVRPRWRGYPAQHPGPEDVFLLVEVADTSLATDRGVKLELYARAGIREFWIVDLTQGVVHVHRGPEGNGYASVAMVGASGRLDVEALAGVAIGAAALFPERPSGDAG